jgi:hypothetical protein
MESLFQSEHKSAYSSADKTALISPFRLLGGDGGVMGVGRSRGERERGFKESEPGAEGGRGDVGVCVGAAGDVGGEGKGGGVSVLSRGGHIKEPGQGSSPFGPCTPGTMSFDSAFLNASLQVLKCLRVEIARQCVWEQLPARTKEQRKRENAESQGRERERERERESQGRERAEKESREGSE